MSDNLLRSIESNRHDINVFRLNYFDVDMRRYWIDVFSWRLFDNPVQSLTH